MEEPRARVEELLGARALEWRRVRRGFAPTLRWVVVLADGRSVFVKLATTEETTKALRLEHASLLHLEGRDFIPRLVAFDDGPPPMIVLGDLSQAAWPPPWSRVRVSRVVDALAQVAACDPPEHARTAKELADRLDGWPHLAVDPTWFLKLGWASERWLERALPVMAESAARAPFDGDALLHMDVRSDNICFSDGRAILVDWNHVTRGNAAFDLAVWAPSLARQGGPLPDELVPDQPGLAAFMAGFFCWKAGLPPEDWKGAGRVRLLQRRQGITALPWAARALGLPEPDGVLK